MLSMMTAYGQVRNFGSSNDRRKDAGIALSIGGVAFTTAAIFEGNSNYTTYVNGTMSTNGTYVTKPLWQQTPRNVVFVVGVGLTITGLLTLLSAR